MDATIETAIREAAARVVADWPPLSSEGRSKLAQLARQIDPAPVNVEQAQPARRAA